MWKPAGDTIIVEREKHDGTIALPESVEIGQEDVFLVKDVGIGYVTEQGVIIAPEVTKGDKVIIKGKVLKFRMIEGEILLARAQDVVCYERGA